MAIAKFGAPPNRRFRSPAIGGRCWSSEKCPGIYENLGRSELWICLADPGSKAERPRTISYSSPGTHTWITLEPIPKAGVEPAAVAAEKPVANELEPFQGIWQMNTCDSENMKLYAPQKEATTWRWAVKGNEIAWSRSSGEVWHLTFKVNPEKSPKEIDLTYLDGPFKGQTCLGMYEWGGVEKNALLKSVQDPGAKVPRPESMP